VLARSGIAEPWAFANFLSSFRFFRSSRACVDSGTRAWIFQPLRPSKETENASDWVRESKGVIGMCCFGGTWMTVVKKSSFFMECFPGQKRVNGGGGINSREEEKIV